MSIVQPPFKHFHLRSIRDIEVDDAELNNEDSDIFDIAQHGHDSRISCMVEGSKVELTLQSNVTQKPKTDRITRLKRNVRNVHAERSNYEVRLTLWLMQFNACGLVLLYLAAFIAMNAVFAGLFVIQDSKCCDDPTHYFAEIFDFTIQTSTTIGYGGYVPQGRVANFLVVMISVTSIVLNTIFAGLLFFKFVTPNVKIQFSDIIVMNNYNGHPCLEIRIGNCDGNANLVTDVSARLTYSYRVTYKDGSGHVRERGDTGTLNLVQDQRHELSAVWTVRHIMDETSPLFGLRFDEEPGASIYYFQLYISGTHNATKVGICELSTYGLQDVLVGHCFQDQISFDEKTKTIICDYSKMNETMPSPVWYPPRKSS